MEDIPQFKAGLTADEIYTRFADRFRKIADETLAEVVGDYLPHAESDLDANVYYRSMEYIAGNFKENTIFGDMGKRFRQRIFEENRDLIVNQLNQDNLDKIKELGSEIAELRRQLWERG